MGSRTVKSAPSDISEGEAATVGMPGQAHYLAIVSVEQVSGCVARAGRDRLAEQLFADRRGEFLRFQGKQNGQMGVALIQGQLGVGCQLAGLGQR